MDATIEQMIEFLNNVSEDGEIVLRFEPANGDIWNSTIYRCKVGLTIKQIASEALENGLRKIGYDVYHDYDRSDVEGPNLAIDLRDGSGLVTTVKGWTVLELAESVCEELYDDSEVRSLINRYRKYL